MQRLQKLVLCKLCKAARHTNHSHCVHGNKDAIDADECYPEVEFPHAFMHEASKHFRKPKIQCGKHTEDRSHAHDQVEVCRDEVCVMHGQIEGGLTQYEPSDTACYKQRHKSDRKQHRSGEPNPCAPQGTQPVECLNR